MVYGSIIPSILMQDEKYASRFIRFSTQPVVELIINLGALLAENLVNDFHNGSPRPIRTTVSSFRERYP